MIEIVRAKAARAKQPFHVRVTALGNREPILAGETLTAEGDAADTLEALGRHFSPVHRAEYAHGVLTVWLDDDDLGEKLHIPIEQVDEREAEPEPVPPNPGTGDRAKRTRKAAES